MGGLLGGSAPSVQASPVYNPAQADLSMENAALFERLQRSRAYGVQGTQIVSALSSANVHSSLGGASGGAAK